MAREPRTTNTDTSTDQQVEVAKVEPVKAEPQALDAKAQEAQAEADKAKAEQQAKEGEAKEAEAAKAKAEQAKSLEGQDTVEGLDGEPVKATPVEDRVQDGVRYQEGEDVYQQGTKPEPAQTLPQALETKPVKPEAFVEDEPGPGQNRKPLA